jgi:4-aminobutyrate aminotransferase-like enzyme
VRARTAGRPLLPRRTDAFETLVGSHVDPGSIAAVLIELQLGEGGFVPAPPAFVAMLAGFCRDHGIVLIDDEIQTGFGRTGRMFAAEHYGVAPDLITTAKSLAGGLPLGAVTGRADIMDAAHVGGLGGTFAGTRGARGGGGGDGRNGPRQHRGARGASR